MKKLLWIFLLLSVAISACAAPAPVATPVATRPVAEVAKTITIADDALESTFAPEVYRLTVPARMSPFKYEFVLIEVKDTAVKYSTAIGYWHDGNLFRRYTEDGFYLDVSRVVEVSEKGVALKINQMVAIDATVKVEGGHVKVLNGSTWEGLIWRVNPEVPRVTIKDALGERPASNPMVIHNQLYRVNIAYGLFGNEYPLDRWVVIDPTQSPPSPYQ